MEETMSIKKLKNKDVNISTSITDDHLSFIEGECHKLGISSSEYLRHLILSQIQLAAQSQPKGLEMGEGWHHLFGFWITDGFKEKLVIAQNQGLYHLIKIGTHWDEAIVLNSASTAATIKSAANHAYKQGEYDRANTAPRASESQYSTLSLPTSRKLTSADASVLISLQANFKRIMNLCILQTQ